MSKYFDVHNHIRNTVPVKSVYSSYCMGNIINLDSVESEFKTAGLHPGYIDCEIPWDFINEKISANPEILIGEVGLDKNCNLREKQLDVFKRFITISINYERSLVIHCVKSWGTLIETIKEDFNRDIPHLYHGYSGSYETLKEAMKGNSFFSFSLRELEREKMEPLIKYIPSDKIMIESDMSDETYKYIGRRNYLERIEESYKLLSKIKSEPLVDLTEIIKNNFTTFLQLGD